MARLVRANHAWCVKGLSGALSALPFRMHVFMGGPNKSDHDGERGGDPGLVPAKPVSVPQHSLTLVRDSYASRSRPQCETPETDTPKTKRDIRPLCETFRGPGHRPSAPLPDDGRKLVA
jgi:hypothetical protein